MWTDACGIEIPPIPRMTFHEAIARYGVDAPDIRFGMELVELTGVLGASTFAPVAGALAAGGIVKAFVVLAPGHEASEALAAELQAHVKQVTAPYKYPRQVEFVDELPKTASGKIRRAELRSKG